MLAGIVAHQQIARKEQQPEKQAIGAEPQEVAAIGPTEQADGEQGWCMGKQHCGDRSGEGASGMRGRRRKSYPDGPGEPACGREDSLWQGPWAWHAVQPFSISATSGAK